MNYLTHYALNTTLRPRPVAPEFHAGVALPDWLSAADRRCRLNAEKVRERVRRGDDPLAHGVFVHEAQDRIFHTGEFFSAATDGIKAALRARKFPGARVRGWFVAHIAFELLLDHWLLQEDPELAERFLAAIARPPSGRLEEQVEAVATRPPRGLAGLVVRFRERGWVRGYRELDGVCEALIRVLQRARQDSLGGPHRAELTAALEEGRERMAALDVRASLARIAEASAELEQRWLAGGELTLRGV